MTCDNDSTNVQPSVSHYFFLLGTVKTVSLRISIIDSLEYIHALQNQQGLIYLSTTKYLMVVDHGAQCTLSFSR